MRRVVAGTALGGGCAGFARGARGRCSTECPAEREDMCRMVSMKRIHKNTRLARIAAEQLFLLEPENGGNHVLLSNVYAASGNWENVVVARKYLRDSGAKKEMGRSWIEAKGKIHNAKSLSEISIDFTTLRMAHSWLQYGKWTKLIHDLHEGSSFL
ncbi:hypothetical protein E2562_024506 [Oryza meyeriana var. granulata]|uniref:Pentatricopeptide repeat-containing protein n=1 Tax=Oryza meyeriana var. granulata TaxID=110450 RepID=A0A6G1BNR4_9ORYZ|nr:hypothetical protein E2562_024506 [Oryza meyeriana var. granulata]